MLPLVPTSTCIDVCREVGIVSGIVDVVKTLSGSSTVLVRSILNLLLQSFFGGSSLSLSPLFYLFMYLFAFSLSIIPYFPWLSLTLNPLSLFVIVGL